MPAWTRSASMARATARVATPAYGTPRAVTAGAAGACATMPAPCARQRRRTTRCDAAAPPPPPPPPPPPAPGAPPALPGDPPPQLGARRQMFDSPLHLGARQDVVG